MPATTGSKQLEEREELLDELGTQKWERHRWRELPGITDTGNRTPLHISRLAPAAILELPVKHLGSPQ